MLNTISIIFLSYPSMEIDTKEGSFKIHSLKGKYLRDYYIE